MALEIDREVINKIKKFDDVEIHVSVVTAQGEQYVEIREYVPSLGAYGKGLTFDDNIINEIVNSLYILNDRLGKENP
jgi:hypothetical protein